MYEVVVAAAAELRREWSELQRTIFKNGVESKKSEQLQFSLTPGLCHLGGQRPRLDWLVHNCLNNMVSGNQFQMTSLIVVFLLCCNMQQTTNNKPTNKY
jgi:hypothetical protein